MVVPKWEGFWKPSIVANTQSRLQMLPVSVLQNENLLHTHMGKLNVQRQWYFPFKLGIRICPLRDSSSHTYADL